jgi:hypothetical protein
VGGERIPYLSIILIVGSQSQISLQTLYFRELYDYIPFNITEHQILAEVTGRRDTAFARDHDMTDDYELRISIRVLLVLRSNNQIKYLKACWNLNTFHETPHFHLLIKEKNYRCDNN